ncbi:Shikimate 5-dehydrogenase I alpha [hydrothermal vent metagenome]|uniref:shikimate dehydrogenase (NADP(+)) n=1 Tax=hydrothermal vent metagenome TaxID=652676 RepID=A0A3B0SHZ9_9ZZZZ
MTKNTTIKAGVVGWPIGHSLSPRLHGYWLKKYHIDGIYEPYAVKPEDLDAFIKTLAEKNITGLNLTVPHKEMILPFLDHMDDTARKIGAVNTITCHDGHLYGTNTDGYGFLTNLKEMAPNWSATDGPAMIIGAGGAARAAIVSLLDAGVPEIKLVNRTRSRAEHLAEIYGDLPITVCDGQELSENLSALSLLVNTTILGMTGQPPLDIDLSELPPSAVVYDIVYNPLETDLLRGAKLNGNIAVDGLGMLLHQAVSAFESWYGQRPEVDNALRKYMLAGFGS